MIYEEMQKQQIKVLENDNRLLAQEIDDYRERINKAIEYIETSLNNPQPFYEYLHGDENGKVENLDKLLNILKGDE